MFYAVSKILWLILQPSSLIAISLMSGTLLLATRFRHVARRLLGGGVAALLVLGFSPLGGVLILPLEERFARPDLNLPGTRVDGIVVLGGAEDPRVGAKRGATATNEAAERMTEAVALARKFPQARVVFSGGSGSITIATQPEAAAAQRVFLGLGLAPERLILEGASRNTHENATLTRALVTPRAGERWLLITSAFHMPRAIGCFRKAGFAIEAYPVDYRTSGYEELWMPFSSMPEGLRRVDFVVKEYAGLLAYYLSGRTDALFPAP